MVPLQQELEQSFAQLIGQSGGQGGSGTGSGAGYTLVTMAKGETMSLEVGCEVLLRVGTAAVRSDGNPALIDLTSGGTVNKDASLSKNHLYMSTIEGRTIAATADTVKLLVRGGYSVG